MSLQRSFAFFMAASLCVVANVSLAEQISGQLLISLTILKRCEVSAQRDDLVVHLTERSCEHAAYQVRDGLGRSVPLALSAEASSVAVQSIENAGSTLVIYW